MVHLAPSDLAPAFTLNDAEGKPVSLHEFKGRRVIAYFYPAASTPACTAQACDFRDSMAVFGAADFQVLGISPDPVAKLAEFSAHEQLNFSLLADADHEVADAYGAWGEKKNYGRSYQGLIRSTFVIDATGRIELAQYNVRAKGHVAKLRKDLGLA